jgi:putative NADH-flavin reductase
VLRQALAAGHTVTAFVRTPSKLPPDVVPRILVHTGDLSQGVPQDIVGGHDALINCAGHVADRDRFVNLIDRMVASVEALPIAQRPACWFLAGAAVLDIDGSGRRAVDLRAVRGTYWPHAANFTLLSGSTLDWRLLCPGPMVDAPAVGVDRLRISLDTLPVQVPSSARNLLDDQLVPLFASLIPQMIVPYADAAAVMLANLGRGSAMSRHRVGLALPVGMHMQKPIASAP